MSEIVSRRSRRICRSSFSASAQKRPPKSGAGRARHAFTCMRRIERQAST